MTYLAFDSSGITCSAAVVRDGKTLASFFANNGLTHSRTLLPAIERVLSESGTEISDIDRIAVTVGPGSFTGVKIGVATAKGLAAVRNTDCVAVSTMASLAVGAASFEGIICPVMDARRSMFYNALFRCENGNLTRLCDDRQASGEEIMKEIGGEKVLITGDGADLFAGMCAGKNVKIFRAPEIISYIHGENIAAAAELFGETTSPEKLCALYLRPPQAERERLERLEREKCK